MTPTHVDGIPLHGAESLGLLDPQSMAADGAILLVDKATGWTSFDVVAKCRGIFRVRKVGHTGTLDPMATGLLVLCFGRATKLVERLQAEEKEYTGTILFGSTTPTDDAESEPDATFPVDHLTRDSIETAAAGFLGESLQYPPRFSARKVGGQRLYAIARRGETVEVAPRAVTVRAFDIVECELPVVRFRVVCSKGTYIRSLARDLGARLGSGAHLTALRRTRSGELRVEDAATVEAIVASRRDISSNVP